MFSLDTSLADPDLQDGRLNFFLKMRNLFYTNLFSHRPLLAHCWPPRHKGGQTLFQKFLPDYLFYSFLLIFNPLQSLISSPKVEMSNSIAKTDGGGRCWISLPVIRHL